MTTEFYVIAYEYENVLGFLQIDSGNDDIATDIRFIGDVSKATRFETLKIANNLAYMVHHLVGWTKNDSTPKIWVKELQEQITLKQIWSKPL